MKKNIQKVLALTLACAMLAGCGGGAAKGDEAPASTENGESGAATSSHERIQHRRRGASENGKRRRWTSDYDHREFYYRVL